ncbi:AAA family ATPase [Micromonospora sp. C72]|uniref:AAA family ATPase n=1 Tax=Micromonospora sp. C72 TaxID=2824880 RepID=UPI001B39245A|nr:AAA family ATPase [Micromonospora sp. C72]MBQ1042375.1 AAA family ATPase [Micromonospora sp. C72]
MSNLSDTSLDANGWTPLIPGLAKPSAERLSRGVYIVKKYSAATLTDDDIRTIQLHDLQKLTATIKEIGAKFPTLDEWEAVTEPHRLMWKSANEIEIIRDLLFGTFKRWEIELFEGLVAAGYFGPHWLLSTREYEERWAKANEQKEKAEEQVAYEEKYREQKLWLKAKRDAERDLDAEEESEEEFVWTTAADRRARPEMSWMIENLVPAGGAVGLPFGDKQSLKTFLMVDLALSLTNDLDHWMGWPIVPDPDGKVRHAGMILMEGASGIQRRINAWLKYHRQLGHCASDDELLTLENQAVNISSKKSIDRLVRSMRKVEIDGDPFNPAVLIVDTQGLALGGTDEYNRPAMRQAYALVKQLAAEFQCLVMLVSHPGHTNKHRPAGASSQEQDSDLVLRIKPGEIEVTKSKESENGLKRMFTWHKVADSLVVEWVNESSSMAGEIKKKTQRDNEIIAAVRELQVTKPGGVSKTAIYEKVGGNKSDLNVNIDRLVMDGRLINNSQREGSFLLTTDEPRPD